MLLRQIGQERERICPVGGRWAGRRREVCELLRVVSWAVGRIGMEQFAVLAIAALAYRVEQARWFPIIAGGGSRGRGLLSGRV